MASLLKIAEITKIPRTKMPRKKERFFCLATENPMIFPAFIRIMIAEAGRDCVRERDRKSISKEEET